MVGGRHPRYGICKKCKENKVLKFMNFCNDCYKRGLREVERDTLLREQWRTKNYQKVK